MSSANAYDLFKAALVAAAAPYRVIDADEIAPELAQGGEPFFALFADMASEMQMSIGSPTNAEWNEMGVFGVKCFVPTGDSYRDARLLVDGIRDALRALWIGTPRMMTINNCHPGLQTGSHRGLWTEMTFECEYTRWFSAAVA